MVAWRNASENFCGADPDEDGVDREVIMEALDESFEEALLVSCKHNASDAENALADALIMTLSGDKRTSLVVPESLQGAMERYWKSDKDTLLGLLGEECIYLENAMTDADILAVNQWIKEQETPMGLTEVVRFSLIKSFEALPSEIQDSLADSWEAPDPY